MILLKQLSFSPSWAIAFYPIRARGIIVKWPGFSMPLNDFHKIVIFRILEPESKF